VAAKKRKKRRDVETLGAVLLRDRAFAGVVAQPLSPIPEKSWEIAVGTRIAARAKPHRLERGVLTVVAATSAWASELSLLADPIVAQLRRLGLDVGSLRFRVGVIEAPPPPARRPPKLVPHPVPLEPTMNDKLAAVPDADLRAAIERAARTTLAYGAQRRTRGSGGRT
jgi:hypothetical protein